MTTRLRQLMLQAGFAAPELANRANKLVELIVEDLVSEIESIQAGDYSHDDYDKGYDSALDGAIAIVKNLSSRPEKQTILNKEYCGEGIIDMSQDIDEMLDERFNPVIKDLPVDEYGIITGTFKLSVTWEADDE